MRCCSSTQKLHSRAYINYLCTAFGWKRNALFKSTFKCNTKLLRLACRRFWKNAIDRNIAHGIEFMRHLIFIIFIFCLKGVFAQDTLLIGHLIPEIVFEDNKEERERFFTPQQMEVISSKSILQSNPSNTADILQKSGAVTVQMSQSGGGSPIIRGFEANRILLVVDGVRLNNAIFRSGHLQKYD